MLTPEVFPRANGMTYVCGINSLPPLPINPGAVVPDEGALERLTTFCARLSPVLARAPMLAADACYRRVTGDRLPLIDPVPGSPGCYVATGHSVCILNAPRDGKGICGTGPERSGDNGQPDAIRAGPLAAARRGTGRADAQAWRVKTGV